MAPQRPYKCGVHCVRKCLRVSDADFKEHGMSVSRATYNNCTRSCIDTCLKATGDEHTLRAQNELDHPQAVDIPAEWLPPLPSDDHKRRR